MKKLAAPEKKEEAKSVEKPAVVNSPPFKTPVIKEAEPILMKPTLDNQLVILLLLLLFFVFFYLLN